MTRIFPKVKTFLLFLFIFSFCIISCNQREVAPLTAIDSFKIIFNDSVYYAPYEMRERVERMMEQTTDSGTWYELLNLYAQSHLFTGETDEGHRAIGRVIGYASTPPESEPKLRLLVDSYNNMAISYMITHHPDSAIYWISKTEEYLHRVKGKPGWQQKVLMNMADLYHQKGDFLSGATYYRKALEVCDSLGTPEKERFFVYTGLAHTYMELHNFERAGYYYDRAAGLLPEVSLFEQVTYLNRRGNFYYFSGDYERCGEYFLRADQLMEDAPDLLYNRRLIQLNLAEVYILRDQPDSTRIMLDECRDFFVETGNLTALHYIETLEVAEALLRKEYDKAGRLIAGAMSDEGAATGIVGIRNTYFRRYYEETGNYRKAFEYLKRDKEVSDSVRSQRVTMSVAETELRYAQDTMLIRRDLLIERQQKQTGNLKLIIVVVLFFLVVALGGFSAVYYRNKKKKELEALRYRYSLSELKMENVRNRISPHFIFNVLSRIGHTAELSPEQQTVFTDIARILKRNLELVDSFTVSLKEELEFIASYLALEGIKADQLEYTVNIGADVDPEKVIIPSMCLHIVVENAVKHGFREMSGNKQLVIGVERRERGVVVTVEDNGKGINVVNGAGNSGTATGMRVLNQTIRLLNSGNREKIELIITNREEGGRISGCRVAFFFPDHYSYTVSGSYR